MEHLFSIVLWTLSLVGYETPRPHAGFAAPRITFQYRPYVDALVCPIARIVHPPLAPPDVDLDFDKLSLELARELPRLQKLWDEHGPVLLKTASELLGSEFSYDRDETGVFFCPVIPSWAKPRLISVWRYLPSVPAKERWRDEEFVDVVFHEHLHLLIDRLLGWRLSSPTLDHYSDEALFTKIHVHLYAVERAVYAKLKMTDQWRALKERARTFPPQYPRAIEIAERDGEALVQELRAVPH